MWTFMPRPSRFLLPLCLTLTIVGCAPSVGPRVAQSSTTPAGVSAPPMTNPATPSPPPTDLGPAPTDLHRLDWASVHIPGEFCGIPAAVTFLDRQATATSSKFGRVHLSSETDAVYGDLDGDGRPEAALKVECDNGGGTADGQLAFGAVILTSRDGRLVALGSATPQEQPSQAVHVTLLSDVRIQHGSVVVHEQWYRKTDMTCCPTGTAETTWTLHGERLSPGTPEITS